MSALIAAKPGGDQMNFTSRSLPKSLKALEEDERMSKRNRELARKYVDFVQLSKPDIKESSLSVFVCSIQAMARYFLVDFDRATKDDVKDAISRIQVEGWKPNTYTIRVIMFKQFMKWLKTGQLERTDPWPEEVRWIKAYFKKLQTLPEGLLSPDDVKRMVDGTTSMRDKCLILVHYEGGLRAGELLSMKIGDVKFNEYGAVVLVSGKTGQRRVRLIASAPLLSKWLDQHPNKSNPDAFVWFSVFQGKPLTYGALCKVFKKVAARVGLDPSKIHTHIFRYSRASEVSNFMAESQMKAQFGWTQASKMAAIYVHLTGSDIDRALFQHNGMVKKEDVKPVLSVIECMRCHERLSPGLQFCYRCGTPIDHQSGYHSHNWLASCHQRHHLGVSGTSWKALSVPTLDEEFT